MSMEEEGSAATKQGDEVFENPAVGGEAADADAMFEGEMPKKSAVPLSPISRARQASNAHHVQKFVNEQVFGEATLDDLDDDDDLDHHKSEWCGLLHPRTARSTAYDLVQMMALFYIVAMVPWRIAFNISTTPSEVLWWCDLVVDLLILFDIMLNLNRYYVDGRSHKLITDRATVRKTYMRSWFLIDLLSVIPFDYLLKAYHKYVIEQEGSAASGRSAKMIRLARLGRLARLVRLAKLANLRKFAKKANIMIREVGISKPGLELIGRIVFLASFVLFVTHVAGCLWISHSRSLSEDKIFPNWYGREYGVTKITAEHPMGITAVDPQPARSTVYVDACYWVLVTMSTVGYGDIVPEDQSERVFACFIILLGAFVWAYIIGAFSSTLNSMDRDKTKYDEYMRSIKALMRFHDVPNEMVERIDAFFEYKFESKTMFDDAQIYDILPARLRADLVLHRFKDTINVIPFFRGCREDAIIEIVSRFKSFSVLPLDYLFHKGDPYVELVVLTKGRMAVVSEDHGDDHHDNMEAELFPGAFFGENEFLGFGRERTMSVRARTFCEVSTLHPEDMEPVLRIHIKLRRRLERYAKLKTEMESKMLASGEEVDVAAMTMMKDGIESEWEEEGAELKECFESIDKDGSGSIDRTEIAALAVEMGRPMKGWELDEAMRVMDTDGSGEVEWEEFAHWWEANDGQLTFNNRDPTEAHNKTMRQMQESMLQLQHDSSERVIALEMSLQKHLEEVDKEFQWVRSQLKGR